MSKLRRYFKPGDYCFVTCVTHERKPILISNIELLMRAFGKATQVDRVEFFAWVILSEHFHTIIHSDEVIISKIIQRIKNTFSANYRIKHNIHSITLWQKRFWDHIIRDEGDLNRHIDYIHFNPVKHGIVNVPFDYKYSTSKRFLLNGQYTEDWGTHKVPEFKGNFGE